MVAILAVRTTDGAGKPTAPASAMATSPTQGRLATLAIIETHNRLAPSSTTATTRAGQWV